MSALPHKNALHSSDHRWLYVDFNSYFASVEQQLQPHLRGRPVAVVPVQTNSTCAIAASYEAKAFGIRTGTPIYEAKKLCPGLVCVLGQHEKYVEYHHRFLEEISRHIPVTAVCSIDEVACELMDNEANMETSTRIAKSIKKGLHENLGEYIRCSIGIAPNRYLAKVATDIQKPDGLTLLSMTDLPQKLLALSLRDLPGIGYSMERRLHAAGIHDMAALWALDAKHMRKIWGSVWGERMWHLLRGADLVEEESMRRTIGHSHVLAPELRDPEKARFVARRLTQKATSRLRRMGYHAGAFSLGIRPENGPRLEGAAKCFRAQDSLTFLHLLEPLWNELMRQAHNKRIKKISVTLHGLTQEVGLQGELFSPLPENERLERLKAERMSRALDRINQRFGRDAAMLGMPPSEARSVTGTKIAFTRIPDVEEFME